MSDTKEMSKEILGMRIREIRKSQGMTGQKFAHKSQISTAYLSEVERGLSVISGEKLLRIAHALNVEIQELLNPEKEIKTNDDQISIPRALSEVAEALNLTFNATLRILDGYKSLSARRSSGSQEEWTKQKWIEFYNKVKFIIEE
jgi:transcriptional regulator with XRE-family HTH domain